MAEHRRQLRKNVHCNPYLQNSWNKYQAIDFKFDLIEITSLSELRAREQWWINNTDNLFNIRINDVNSPLGTEWSLETRNKMKAASDSLEAKNRRREAALHYLANNPDKPGLFTKETAKLANLKKAKAYLGISPTGRVLCFCNMNFFCREFGLRQPNVSAVVSGRRKFHAGWSFLNLTDEIKTIVGISDLEVNSFVELTLEEDVINSIFNKDNNDNNPI